MLGTQVLQACSQGSREKVGPCVPCRDPGAPKSLQPSSAPSDQHSEYRS